MARHINAEVGYMAACFGALTGVCFSVATALSYGIDIGELAATPGNGAVIGGVTATLALGTIILIEVESRLP